jgi:hypothetical protein
LKPHFAQADFFPLTIKMMMVKFLGEIEEAHQEIKIIIIMVAED